MCLFPYTIVGTGVLDGPSIPEAVIAVVFHLLLWYINHEVIAMTGWFDRKNMRLSGYNYNSPGTYFLTICAKNRKCLLSRIDESNILEGPILELLPYGKIAAGYINQLHDFYDNISVESYVVMPNHIHIMLSVLGANTMDSTIQNSVVSRFVSTWKRFCNKEYGQNIWQPRFYDHIIRNQEDFDRHMKYICENPFSWHKDEFYSKE